MIRKLLLLIGLILILNFTSAQCDDPSAFDNLDIGNVQALITNGGDFWFDGTVSVYNTPQFDPNTSVLDKRILFAGGIWLSAKNNTGNLKVAAMSYRNQGFEFYPGPIDNITGMVDNQTCTFYNQIWEVKDAEVQEHITLSNNTLPISLNLINANILYWPAKGNSHISAVTITDDLAPFVDVNSNNIYDPEFGDYPKIQGDQALFWVMNDISGPHQVYKGEALEVQVQMLAYAYSSGLLTNTTIYECKVINKSFGNLHDFRFGLFIDPDLPNPTNNYVGCDTIRDASFAYLASAGTINPPVSSVFFLNQEMQSFNYFVNGGGSNISDPNNHLEVNNLLHARYPNGIPFSISGSQGPIPIKYMFPGNPSNPSEWAMNNTSSAVPADLRTLQTTGIPTLNAWTSFDVSWAVHTSFPENYQANTFYNEVAIEIDSIKTLFDNFNEKYDYGHLTSIGSSSILNSQISLFPNPVQDFLQLDLGDLKVLEIQVLNIKGQVLKQIATPANHSSMDLSDFPFGVYFIKVITTDGFAMKKLIKN